MLLRKQICPEMLHHGQSLAQLVYDLAGLLHQVGSTDTHPALGMCSFCRLPSRQLPFKHLSVRKPSLIMGHEYSFRHFGITRQWRTSLCKGAASDIGFTALHVVGSGKSASLAAYQGSPQRGSSILCCSTSCQLASIGLGTSTQVQCTAHHQTLIKP